MKNYGNSFEDAFRDAFQDAELEPSDKLWSNLDKELDRKRPVRLGWWWASGIAASILVAITVVFFLREEPVDTVAVTRQTPATGQQQPAHTPAQQQNAASQSVTGNDLVAQSNNTPLTATDKATPSTGQQKITYPAGQGSNGKDGNDNPRVTYDKNATHPGGISVPPSKKDKNGNGVNTEPNTPVLPTTPGDMALLTPLEPGLTAEATRMQPDLKMVAVVSIATPNETQEATAKAGKWWVSAGGFYNAYNPAFSAISSRAQVSRPLESMFLKGSIQFYKATDDNFAGDLENSISNISSFTTGAEFGRRFGRHFGVSSGLTYTTMSFSVQTAVASVKAIDAQADIVLDNTVHSRTTLLSMPVKLHYQVDRNKLNYGIFGGIVTDFMQQTSLRSDISTVSYQIAPYRKVNLNGVAGVGVNYSLWKAMSIGLEASFKQSLQNVYDSEDIKSQPRWISVGGVIRYKF